MDSHLFINHITYLLFLLLHNPVSNIVRMTFYYKFIIGRLKILSSFCLKTGKPTRKQTVLAELQKQAMERKELKNGFGYKSNGTGEMIDLLPVFVKTERLCCDFFNYTISTTPVELVWLGV